MAMQSSMKNMFMCLFSVCLICSALLGGAYALTKDKIAKAETDKKNQAIAKVVPSFDNAPSDEMFTITLDGKAYDVYPATLQGAPVGYAINCAAGGFSGAVTVMVGITVDRIVYNTVPVSHSETPGLGAKISEEGNTFVAQFKGLDPLKTNLKVKKDGGDLDAITASTITSRAYISAVSTALAVFDKIQEEQQ